MDMVYAFVEIIEIHESGSITVRFVYYDITKGVHMSAIGCIHKRYDSLANKDDF